MASSLQAKPIFASCRISLVALALLFSLTLAPEANAATPLWECIAGPGLTVTVASNLQSPNECIAPLKVYAKDHIVPRICAPYITSGYQVNSVWLHSQENMPDGKQVHYMFEASLLIFNPAGPPMGCVEDYFAVAQIQKQKCPVPPLTPLTDPVALGFENGDRWRPDLLTADYQTKLSCVQNEITAAGGTYANSSAYRPTQYQQHLYEIVDRDWRLNPVVMHDNPGCQSLRKRVTDEMKDHGLKYRQPVAPPGSSRHEFRTAFDVTPIGLNDPQLTPIYSSCGVTHTAVPGEPWHTQ